MIRDLWFSSICRFGHWQKDAISLKCVWLAIKSEIYIASLIPISRMPFGWTGARKDRDIIFIVHLTESHVQSRQSRECRPRCVISLFPLWFVQTIYGGRCMKSPRSASLECLQQHFIVLNEFRLSSHRSTAFQCCWHGPGMKCLWCWIITSCLSSVQQVG